MSMSNATFNPREHVITIKNRQGGVSEYLPVQWRLVWFRSEYPEGSIETEVVIIDLDRVVEVEQFAWNAEKRRNEKIVKTGKGFACFKTTVRTGQGGSASATGSESAADFGDFIEKAETKSIGRALAGLGFGSQFAPELNEGQRLVDAPVDNQGAPQSQQSHSSTPDDQPGVATPIQSPVAGQEEVVPSFEDIKTLFIATFNAEGWERYVKAQVGLKSAYSIADCKKLSDRLNAMIKHNKEATAKK